MQRIPARKLTRSAVKNIVRFPAIKSNGGKNILVESVLESDFCLHLEFGADVLTYFPQPKTFQVPDSTGFTTYTPDFEVHYHSGKRCYVEVKPLAKASSDHYQDLFERFARMLIDTQYSFVVVHETPIRQLPLLDNYQKLYRFRKRPALNMRTLHECASTMNFTVPLSVLIAKLKGRSSLKEIYTWLALSYLTFDMENTILTLDTEVKFNVE